MKAKLNPIEVLQPEMGALIVPVSITVGEMLASATQGNYLAASAALDVIAARLPDLRRALEDEAKQVPTEPNACYIAIGPNVWGRGKTPDEAVTLCSKAAYGRGLLEYDLYRCHKDATVSDMGGITYPEGTKIQQIANVRAARKASK